MAVALTRACVVGTQVDVASIMRADLSKTVTCGWSYEGGVTSCTAAQIGTTGDGTREGGCCLLIQLPRRERICC